MRKIGFGGRAFREAGCAGSSAKTTSLGASSSAARGCGGRGGGLRGGREEAAAPIPALSPEVVSEGEPSSSSSSPSSGEEEVYTGDRPDVPPYPEMIQGVRVRPPFKTTTNKWGIEVTCPHHANCRRFRTLDLHTDVFGHQAAELYLALWLTTPNPPNGKRHNR